MPRFQFNETLHSHPVENDQIIAYSEGTRTPDRRAFDWEGRQGCDRGDRQPGPCARAVGMWVALDLSVLGVDPTRPYLMHDLLTDARYEWEGGRNFVILDPAGLAAHLFALEQETELAPSGAIV